jgi:anthranilate synthase component 2
MKKLVIIDNYDSFTYNLAHYLEDLGCQVTIYRNDTFDLEEIEPFEYIVLSPGPGIPDEAGLTKKVIQTYGKNRKIMGVCLGLQAIAEVFGGKLLNLNQVFHGVSSVIKIIEPSHFMFQNIPNPMEVGRYHSWVMDAKQIPDCIQILAQDDDGSIMAIQHKELNICAVQFHPESILTPDGKKLLQNWLEQSL